MLYHKDSVIVADDHLWRRINLTYPAPIPLTIHSHRGHLHNDSDYAPHHVLYDDDLYYFSKEEVTGDDWIVFSGIIAQFHFFYVKMQLTSLISSAR